MKRTSKSELPRWRVSRIGGARAREICELAAKNADEAIKRTIREYDIPQADHGRSAAYQVTSR